MISVLVKPNEPFGWVYLLLILSCWVGLCAKRELAERLLAKDSRLPFFFGTSVYLKVKHNVQICSIKGLNVPSSVF